ncbi:G2/mitotic-specific cyclin-B-like isoform X1 [Palaemon carinicauda]|uniref:G2/mitotic-specific cyclin-B-like isoform X1 n=1 Tax=Palaemon carinicauda TaxID=392227 RepID=UPI0035B580F8
MANKLEKKFKLTIHEDNDSCKIFKRKGKGLENHIGFKGKEKQKNTELKPTKIKKVGKFSITLSATKTTKKSESDNIYLRSKKIARRLGEGCSRLSQRCKYTAVKQTSGKQQKVDTHVLHVPRYDPFKKCETVWQRRTPFLAREYEEDVMRYLLEVESRQLTTRNYLATHPSVTQRSRAMLIDWLIQVQSYLELSQETLYQSIHLIDRVLEVYDMPVDKIQLLAITAFFIISKLEENEPVEASELLGLTLNSYTLQEFLAMEREVLVVLNFNLISIDPSTFLEYFAYLTCNYDDKRVLDCANFLMETVLVEVWPMETRPSLLAAAALFGSLRITYSAMASNVVCTLIPAFFGLDEDVVVSTSLRMLEAVSNRKHNPFQGSAEKYLNKSRRSGLDILPMLQPDKILLIIDQVRATLISFRDVNIIIRDQQSHHSNNNGVMDDLEDETELDVTDTDIEDIE